MFKLNPKMYTFKFNKPHSKIICGSKVRVKTMRKCHFFRFRFQIDFSTFELWLLPKYYELLNYPWLKYVKLIIGARDHNLLTGTKSGVYINTTKSVIRLASKNKHWHDIEIICSFVDLFIFGASLMTLLGVLVVHKCVILMDKCLNFKLRWKKNYNTKPPKKKKKINASPISELRDRKSNIFCKIL